jgi:hypothetical protein
MLNIFAIQRRLKTGQLISANWGFVHAVKDTGSSSYGWDSRRATEQLGPLLQFLHLNLFSDL